MSTENESAYSVLSERFGRSGRLYAAKVSLFWDSQTYMPKGAAWSRGEQMAAIDAARHELTSGADANDLLATAETTSDTLGGVEQANLREMRRLFGHVSAVPKNLVMAKARAVSEVQAAWVAARHADDFAAFAAPFTKLMSLTREIGQAKAEALGLTPYDALIDELDPGLTTTQIDPIFDDLASTLPNLLSHVVERQASWPTPIPFIGDFSVERQRAFSYKLASAIGHDPHNLRIDIAPHPFSVTGSPGDYRITSRFDAENVLFAVMATLHESGHALYEAGLPRELAFLPVGAARGLTMHESQSLMLEMQAARSLEFIAYLAPQLEQAFGGGGACWNVANLQNVYRRVNAGHIRIEADEVSYPLHIILRYRIERALLSGDLAVDDLPGAWSDLSQQLLGRRPPNHVSGCLQDIHWSMGMLGYFPSYAFGAIVAAQLFESAVRDEPVLMSDLSVGDFSSYRRWVAPRVHARASQAPLAEIVKDATGSPISAAAYKRHLQRRYCDEPAPGACGL